MNKHSAVALLKRSDTLNVYIQTLLSSFLMATVVASLAIKNAMISNLL